MPEWILLLPVLFPIVGAFGFRLGARNVSSRVQPWLPAGFLLLEIGAILVNIAPVNHRLVISDWKLASFSLILQMDGIALVLLLAIFVLMLALWLIAPPRAPFDPFPVLVWTGAILLMLAGNLITIYFASVLLDLAILAWRLARDIDRETALRGFVTSLLAGFVLFAGLQFWGTAYSTTATWFVAIAFWARLGLFPFHWILPMRGADSRDLWTARAIPIIAGASLWVRWSTLQVTAPWQLILFLVLFAMGAAAVWTWREEQPARVALACATHSVALVPLAIAYAGKSGMALALWMTLGNAFALVLFEMALRWRSENRNRWVRLIWFSGLLATAGLPLTPAYLGRTGLDVSLWASADRWLLLVIGILTILILMPLWTIGESLEGADPRDPTRPEYAGLQIAVLAWLALSLASGWITSALTLDAADSVVQALGLTVWTSNVLGAAVGFVVVIAPVVISLLLAHRGPQLRPEPNSLIPRVGHAVDLDWVEQGLGAVGYEMGAAARNVSALAEENPAVWILLVALWIAIFIILPR